MLVFTNNLKALQMLMELNMFGPGTFALYKNDFFFVEENKN